MERTSPAAFPIILKIFILQQMSMRLRQISRDYTGACRTVSDVMEADNAGIEKSPALKNHNAKTLA